MFVQEDYRSVIAVPYDLPVVGYGNNTVNTLRIWDAEPVNTFNLNSFVRVITRRRLRKKTLQRILSKCFIRMITIMQVRSCV